MTDVSNKSAIRREIRERLAGLSGLDRHAQSMASCALVTSLPEFKAAGVVMLFLSTVDEIDTAPLALRCWRDNKTVVVPKVSWDQRRMLPVEINSLTADITSTGPGIREPIGGKPMPVDLIDFAIVPGLAFTAEGHRLGRGMGFYDRFLAQPEFIGVSCGLGFEEQVLSSLPVLDHDIPLSMLATCRGIRRFASQAIPH